MLKSTGLRRSAKRLSNGRSRIIPLSRPIGGTASKGEIRTMSGEEHYTHSQLFTVRVWQPDTADEHTEWRGKLCHIPSGEIRYFRGWAALIPLMLDMLRRHTPPAAAESPAATGEG